MATTKARIGKGTTIGYAADATSAPSSYTAFLEVKKIVPPANKITSVKATHYLSPGGVHEFIPGWEDAGEASFEANYIDTDLVTLEGLKQIFAWFQIKLPLKNAEVTAAAYVFRGFITSLGGGLDNESAADTKVTFKISGPIVFTPAA